MNIIAVLLIVGFCLFVKWLAGDVDPDIIEQQNWWW